MRRSTTQSRFRVTAKSSSVERPRTGTPCCDSTPMDSRLQLRFGRHRDQHLWRDVAMSLPWPYSRTGKSWPQRRDSTGPIGRFNSDGSIDTTFGNGRFATSMSVFTTIGSPNAFALQADGKILITGSGLIGRYTSTGQLDPTFGTNGIAPLNAATATAMVVLPSGQILVTTGSGAPSLISVGAGVSFNLPIPQAGAIAATTLTGAWIRRSASRDKQPVWRRRPASPFKAMAKSLSPAPSPAHSLLHPRTVARS